MRLNSKRSNCIFDNSKLKLIYTFKKFPIFIGATKQGILKDKFVDMQIGISQKDLVQLKTLVNPKLLYSKFHSEAIGQTWKKHHKEFLRFLKKYSGQYVLEMGSGPLKPYHNLVNLKNFEKWTSIEPSKNIKSNILKKPKNKIIKGFIEDIQINKVKNCDTLVHSHVIEHLFNPKKTLKKISQIKNLRKMVFSVPDLEYYIKKKYSNSLNFEHTYFINKKLIKYFLNSIGFKIAKTQKFQNHSVFYYAVKSRKQILPQPTFKKNKNDYLLMIKFYKNKIKKINQMMKKHDGNIYIFGAHVFSQFLINFGLDINRISYVLDNSYLKTNQRLYGYNLHIKKPEIIKKDFKPLIIAIVGQYEKEINSQIKSLNKSAKIIN